MALHTVKGHIGREIRTIVTRLRGPLPADQKGWRSWAGRRRPNPVPDPVGRRRRGEDEMSGSQDSVSAAELRSALEKVADELELTENSSQKQRRDMT